MTIEARSYVSPAHGGGDCDVSPSATMFSIDAGTARRIVMLSELVKANDLHKVEGFDYRASFLQFDPATDPEDAAEAGEANTLRTECDVLVVTREDFYFSAYIKHTDIEISCEGVPINLLKEHFGLSTPEAIAG